MSFLPDDLDKQAAAMPTTRTTPLSQTGSGASSLLSQTLPAQAAIPRSFSDPSYLMEINDLRGKVKAGTATKDDMKRIIALIRETRGAVSSAPVKTKRASAGTAKSKAANPDGQALLDLL